jgi:hypothetical protein
VQKIQETPGKIRMSTTPPFTTAAIGRIERKKAKAASALRGELVRYWQHVRDSRVRQGWFKAEEVVSDFGEYSLAARGNSHWFHGGTWHPKERRI